MRGTQEKNQGTFALKNQKSVRVRNLIHKRNFNQNEDSFSHVLHVDKDTKSVKNTKDIKRIKDVKNVENTEKELYQKKDFNQKDFYQTKIQRRTNEKFKNLSFSKRRKALKIREKLTKGDSLKNKLCGQSGITLMVLVLTIIIMIILASISINAVIRR